MMSEENVCTKDHPYVEGQPGRWNHPEAVEIEEDYGRRGGVADGDFIRYECPICGKKFWEELPN